MTPTELYYWVIDRIRHIVKDPYADPHIFKSADQIYIVVDGRIWRIELVEWKDGENVQTKADR